MIEREQAAAPVRKWNPDGEHFTEEGCYINELSNHQADPDVSIARARVIPGMTTVVHYLVGITERYLILEGQGLITVGDLEPQTVAPGDIIVVPADVSQAIENTGSSDLVFLCICTPRFQWDCYRRAGN